MINPVCDLPWRIHWRIGESLPGPHLEAVKECQPLAMTVEVNDHAHLGPLDLPWPSTAVVVVLNGWRAVNGPPPDEGIVRWEIPVTGPAQAHEAAGKLFRFISPDQAAFRWIPVRGTLSQLPVMLEICTREGCGLTLPNRPADVITAKERDVVPGMKELDENSLAILKERSRQMGRDRLRVHDFILSAAMDLEGPEPLGCEAGNSIAYLDSGGAVYPCSSLLVKMGDLATESLADIWAKPIRSRIRKDVSALPPVCSGCSVLVRCQGGCRGIVYHLKGHFGAPDPLCSVSDE